MLCGAEVAGGHGGNPFEQGLAIDCLEGEWLRYYRRCFVVSREEEWPGQRGFDGRGTGILLPPVSPLKVFSELDDPRERQLCSWSLA